MVFCIDERIQSTCFTLGEWPLSQVLLKNEAAYPWFILVPRKANIQEIFQLEKDERNTLMEEINYLSLLINDYFKPDKLNIGALGNVVPQLHVHIVARFQNDILWPQSIWHSSVEPSTYNEVHLKSLLPALGDLVRRIKIFG